MLAHQLRHVLNLLAQDLDHLALLRRLQPERLALRLHGSEVVPFGLQVLQFLQLQVHPRAQLRDLRVGGLDGALLLLEGSGQVRHGPLGALQRHLLGCQLFHHFAEHLFGGFKLSSQGGHFLQTFILSLNGCHLIVKEEFHGFRRTGSGLKRSDKLAQEGEIMNMTVPPVVLLSELHAVD